MEKEPSSQIDTDAITTAKSHDLKEKDNLLSRDEQAVFVDSANVNKEDKRKARKNGVYYGMLDKATRSKKNYLRHKKRRTLKTQRYVQRLSTRLLL